ncbi:MAG: IS1634 family transposase [Deltaproteobacteria bacterium]|nr:IS1634 family transposase [Deltaproteobacteria bacterium]
MYVERATSKQNGKVYQRVLLRESYREPGAPRSAVKKRTLLNLTKYPDQIVSAIELALKHKSDLSVLGSLQDVTLTQGPSVGGVFTLFQTAKSLGIEKALGSDHDGKLALWQVIARVLDQGSRLSAVRLAKTHAAASVIGFERGFTEDNLYENLTWLSENQVEIENRLFLARRGEIKPQLFLYDVTSSYLEGDQNELADWGYNRDKKRGKKQIVIGLLCDQDGEPVSTEVFQGNTSDLQTFESQIKKAADRFGCERVTFVGDRGMIKSGQIEELAKVGFHYITAITKPQIRAMIKKDVFQIGFFDEKLCEAEVGGVRYILRRNPMRAQEMAASRTSKLAALKALADQQNQYLAEHPKADQHKAWKLVSEKEGRLGLSSFVRVTAENRRVKVEVDEEYLAEIAELDGCYALKTDLPVEAAEAQTVHDRYKDLALVETAFRTSKTDHLEVRPVFVRTEPNTRGHVLVVMLAYLMVRALKKAWAGFDLTVEEGLDCLNRLCAMEMSIKGGASFLRLPNPDKRTKGLLDALLVNLPAALPKSNVKVDTKKKLNESRN